MFVENMLHVGQPNSYIKYRTHTRVMERRSGPRPSIIAVWAYRALAAILLILIIVFLSLALGREPDGMILPLLSSALMRMSTLHWKL